MASRKTKESIVKDITRIFGGECDARNSHGTIVFYTGESNLYVRQAIAEICRKSKLDYHLDWFVSNPDK